MKNSLLFVAPVFSRSGYGDHARDILRSLINLDKYNLMVVPINWGSTPNEYMESDLKNVIEKYLVTQITEQPDISIQLTIPNEFKKIAKYNIGITAGIETSLASAKWIEHINTMDLVIVPSEFAKQVFLNSKYEMIDRNTNSNQGLLECKVPIEVLFEGTDEKIFYQKDYQSKTIRNIFENIPENFTFLFVGHWLNGGVGEDRKNVGLMIKLFLTAFSQGIFRSIPPHKKPALILKTGVNFGNVEINDYKQKIEKIKENLLKNDKDLILPNIYIISGELTPEQLNEVYNHDKVKCMISLTKGEGFGRPLLEFSFTGKPIIASGWSGHLTFLDKDLSLLLPGTLKPIDKSAVWKDILIPESQWFNVNEQAVIKSLLNMQINYNHFKTNAEKLQKINTEKFTMNKMTEQFKEILEKYIPDIPVFCEFELPDLPTLPTNEESNG